MERIFANVHENSRWQMEENAKRVILISTITLFNSK